MSMSMLILAVIVPSVIVVSAFPIIPARTTSTRQQLGGHPNPNNRQYPKVTSYLQAGLFGPIQSYSYNNTYISPNSDWQIYVDQSKASLDRGGASTLDAFSSLCFLLEDNLEIQVIPAMLPKPIGGGKGPWIRCVWNTQKKDKVRPSPNLDMSNVDSVDKVYRVLTRHIGVENVSRETCECLKWKYKGNAFLEAGQIKPAIDAYNEALSTCEEHQSGKSLPILKQQEGIVLLLRASAFLQQAQSHKEVLQTELALGDEETLSGSEVLQTLLSDNLSPSLVSFPLPIKTEKDAADKKKEGPTSKKTASELEGSPLPPSVDDASTIDPELFMMRKAQLRKLQFRHGLYQTSLLQAARDALRATEILPDYPVAWLRAGELLSDLWKIKESQQYYEKATSIDESLKESLSTILHQLEERRALVNEARSSWPEDALQLALDIAG